MDDDPKAPVADEQHLEAAEAARGSDDSASDSDAAPDVTALEALKQGAETWKQWRSDHPDVSSPGKAYKETLAGVEAIFDPVEGQKIDLTTRIDAADALALGWPKNGALYGTNRVGPPNVP